MMSLMIVTILPIKANNNFFSEWNITHPALSIILMLDLTPANKS